MRGCAMERRGIHCGDVCEDVDDVDRRGDQCDDVNADQHKCDGNADEGGGGRCVNLVGHESADRGWEASLTESDDEGADKGIFKGRSLEAKMVTRARVAAKRHRAFSPNGGDEDGGGLQFILVADNPDIQERLAEW